MGSRTKIEWAEATWNPIVGCTPVSAGCAHCYAATFASRFYSVGKGESLTDMAGRVVHQFPHKLAGLAHAGKWNGTVRLHESSLDQPHRWRKPRRIFVCSMSDLFHESVPDEWIDRVFAVMAQSREHRFQCLTKRPQRMLAYVGAAGVQDRIAGWLKGNHHQMVVDASVRWVGPWPLPNVWLGVSVEDQRAADERIPLLLQTPAAVRWVSAEPLLGPLSFGPDVCTLPSIASLDWFVIGGESGPRARPCDVEWIRSVVRQCREAGTACFVKQLGQNPMLTGAPWMDNLRDRKGGDPAEWSEDIRVREFPKC